MNMQTAGRETEATVTSKHLFLLTGLLLDILIFIFTISVTF